MKIEITLEPGWNGKMSFIKEDNVIQTIKEENITTIPGAISPRTNTFIILRKIGNIEEDDSFYLARVIDGNGILTEEWQTIYGPNCSQDGIKDLFFYHWGCIADSMRFQELESNIYQIFLRPGEIPQEKRLEKKLDWKAFTAQDVESMAVVPPELKKFYI